MISSLPLTLSAADPGDLAAFKKELQGAFAVAVIAEFGTLPDGPIPSDSDLDSSFSAPGAVVLHIHFGADRVGGAVITLDRTTHHNSLDFFFISPREHGRGLGVRAWQAIEARYPETAVWQTVTPYFEKRNIHFYVNKCGFKVVEFFNARHLDPHRHDESDVTGSWEMFRFEKVMGRPDAP